jgi:hypothetical protein
MTPAQEDDLASPRTATEIAALRARVRELEDLVAELRAQIVEEIDTAAKTYGRISDLALACAAEGWARRAR